MKTGACSVCNDDEGRERICGGCRHQLQDMRGALENLVGEVRASGGHRKSLGLKMSVALNVAERALRIRPVDGC